MNSPRLAARAIILHENRLLMVNAYGPEATGPVARDLWCAPGGGVERGASLPDNLRREVHEETGLTIKVGTPCLVNEFHDPDGTFHQVDIYFRCQLLAGQLDDTWRDSAGVVTHRRWFERAELERGTICFKPDSLPHVAWGRGIGYDPLEPILR